ncbi:hydroxymethylglutaryl-CoA lyase [Nadsonia fulvescens var. elongata DSM 6958]|uniref:hydroxymethylglutaryl-CoA lyase n=1 Tax=Nadsonia fulvescens var. elongata DSM 6958 TaxID=857566 RepID=A0A1E3PFI7_9ASCO|nr:hydroxymethylglutaryl-CoA lyase [Nadsonia fulvescens var. elongata DSM 6958]
MTSSVLSFERVLSRSVGWSRAVRYSPTAKKGASLARLYNAATMGKRERVHLVETSPRDGFQNESIRIPTHIKTELIDRLSRTGLSTIEPTAFVSPKWVPQMFDSEQVARHVVETHYQTSGNSSDQKINFPALVPNVTGLERALASYGGSENLKTVSFFTAASETFSKRNINCSIERSLENLKQVIELANSHNIQVRGYISVAIACPFEGATPPEQVAQLAETLIKMGCFEVSLGDTIGMGTVKTTAKLIEKVSQRVPLNQIALHAHDTYGQGVANVTKAAELGIRTFDSSLGGIGGCPYSKGASGNVATEDLVYVLEDMGFDTGVDLELLAETGDWVSEALDMPYGSKAGRAVLSQLSLAI